MIPGMELPADLRVALAQQVRDESRHFELLAARIRVHRVGLYDYPVGFLVWDRFLESGDVTEALIIEHVWARVPPSIAQREGLGNSANSVMTTLPTPSGTSSATSWFTFALLSDGSRGSSDRKSKSQKRSRNAATTQPVQPLRGTYRS
jgi:hypothetical protein